ncbi:protein FAM90A1 isoform X1 [Homo sapiens]|uniref:protein FAM90A1 isoform X1 n=1 Tax=Homo sapiens TaxID=9606 RepID=UPI0023E01F19|nr:protein FAM90A1 isoform X1 [Homo sapiens]XP_054228364.1 protein FAM90A1 isoform X1 [Homo sapiens]
MMARRDPKPGAKRLVRAQTLQKQRRAPVGPRAPPPDEEDPRLKCKNCEAFGHTARSTRCPMKCWKAALVPPNFGEKEGKENLKPWKPQVEANPGPLNKDKGEKEERPRPQDPQRKALLHIFSGKPPEKPLPNQKGSTESSDYLRVASGPMPVHTTSKRPRVDPVLSDRSATEMSDRGSVLASLSPLRKASLSSSSSLGPKERQTGAAADIPQTAVRHQGPEPLLVVKPTHSSPEGGCREVPQAASKTHGLLQAARPQAQDKRPAVTSQPCPPAATHSLGLGSNLSFGPGAKRSALAPIQACLNFPKKPRLGPFQIPESAIQGGELGAPENLQPLPAATELGPRTSPQIGTRTPAQVLSGDRQPPHSRPCLPTAQACTMSHHPAASHDGAQPLRVLFRRLENGRWSSSLLTAPSFHSPEKPGAFLAQSPHVSEKSEGPCVRVPPSVLYEDLQVPSSSEDSDSDLE